jgi:hypothetical protein
MLVGWQSAVSDQLDISTPIECFRRHGLSHNLTVPSPMASKSGESDSLIAILLVRYPHLLHVAIEDSGERHFGRALSP